MKRREPDQSHSRERNKSVQSDGPPCVSVQQLATRTGLSLFMLQTLGDMHDAKSGKYSGQPLLIDYVHNYALPSLGPAALAAYRAQQPATAKLSDDETILHQLRAYEKQLSRATVQIAGADGQSERMPARERDTRMIERFVSYAKTDGNYYVYVYYVGPECATQELTRQAQAQERHWALVPKQHLTYFHKRIKKVDEYRAHNRNDQVAISAQLPRPLYDPRYIVVRWRKQKENAQALALITRNLTLLTRREEPVLQELRALKKFCPVRDRAEQAKRGFVLHDHPRLSRISMEEFPDLYRAPLARQIEFSLDDLIYLAQRLNTRDAWDPLVLVRALTIALNCDAHIKRLLSQVCDRHALILERDDVTPIIDHLTRDPQAVAEIKQAVMEYVYALLAVDLVTREQLPAEIEAKMRVAGPCDLNMLEV